MKCDRRRDVMRSHACFSMKKACPHKCRQAEILQKRVLFRSRVSAETDLARSRPCVRLIEVVVLTGSRRRGTCCQPAIEVLDHAAAIEQKLDRLQSRVIRIGRISSSAAVAGHPPALRSDAADRARRNDVLPADLRSTIEQVDDVHIRLKRKTVVSSKPVLMIDIQIGTVERSGTSEVTTLVNNDGRAAMKLAYVVRGAPDCGVVKNETAVVLLLLQSKS